MANRSEMLVAIMNNTVDLNIVREKFWYRIPVSSAEKWLKKNWPPERLAFYQTKKFGDDAFAVTYYAEVVKIRKASRLELFPNEGYSKKKHKMYYQIFISDLKELPKPILSRRMRRIIFIPTTLKKFHNAVEINDLYNESPLEDRLWAEFKRSNINAERQELVGIKGNNYFLDFAIYCVAGKLDIEADGNTWHANPEKATEDNIRDNHIKTEGWRVLRFNTHQIQEEMASYCIKTIKENIDKLGGLDRLDTGKNACPRKIILNKKDIQTQLKLF